jgi:hypothetical protein
MVGVDRGNRFPETRIMSRMKLTVLACAVAFIAAAPLSAAGPIPAEKFDKLQALIKPGKGEDRWAAIPWQTSLWEARKLAAEQGKPILLWEMDGHPLGCT